MTKTLTQRVLPILLPLFASGCLHQAVAVAPSSEPLAPGSYEKLGAVTGSDCLWKLFGLLPITSGNTLQGAMQGALSQRPGTDALVQVTADTFQQYWIVISRECSQIEGVAVRVRR